MPTTYAQKQATAQKKDAPTASSVLDNSSQNEDLQRKADMANNAAQREEATRPNNTGMPDNLKSGIESLSGFSMDDVRVHYNSSKPATVQALAYTQGTDIHVAPGQEKHLPHEAWHVAQQMAGRVSPTTNINGMPVNDNAGLEHEADVMGEKAVQRKGCKRLCLQQNKQKKIDCKQRMPEIKNLAGYTCKEDSKKKGHVENGSTIKLESPIYRGTDSPPKNMVNGEKVKALSAIAFEAGRLGKIIKDKFDENEFLQAEIYANYKKRTSNETENLALTYRFGKKWSGYVVKVSKVCEKKEGSSKNAAMYDSGEIVYKGEEGEFFERYSNKHADTGGSSILEESYTKKAKPFSETVPDAYTKLAGEGARFQCVRRNIESINDNTVFYPIGQTGKEKYGIKFSDLWKSWKTSFDKEYNISDKDISEKMTKKSYQLEMSGGGQSSIEIAPPENRVKLDGFSTIDSEKNFDDKLVELSWKLELDSSVMDTIQELEQEEKNIVYQMNSQTVLNTYLVLPKESRDKINDLRIEYIEKFISLKDTEKSTFYALDITTEEKQKLLDMNVDQIGKILILEKTLIKDVLALEPGNIGKIISLDSVNIKKFFQVFTKDQRKKIFEWDLHAKKIIDFLKLKETQINLIFKHCKNANQVINTLRFDFILELAESDFAIVINFDDDLISQISQFKIFGHDISALFNIYKDQGILKYIFLDLNLTNSSIDGLVHSTTEQRDKILKLDKDKIDKLFTFDGDNLTTLLNFNSDDLEKILSIQGDPIITEFLTDVEEAPRTALLKLEKDGFCRLIVEFQHKGMKALNSFAKRKKNLDPYKVKLSP